MSGGELAWLSVWGKVQICICTSSHTADPTTTHCLLLQEIQTGFGFTFLIPAHPSSPGQNPESRKMVVIVVVVAIVVVAVPVVAM